MSDNLFHVKNGEEALDFIFATGKYADTRNILYPPKVILLDIQMPKVNGIEVLSELSRQPYPFNTCCDPDLVKKTRIYRNAMTWAPMIIL